MQWTKNVADNLKHQRQQWESTLREEGDLHLFTPVIDEILMTNVVVDLLKHSFTEGYCKTTKRTKLGKHGKFPMTSEELDNVQSKLNLAPNKT